jgi:hypothetical protein
MYGVILFPPDLCSLLAMCLEVRVEIALDHIYTRTSFVLLTHLLKIKVMFGFTV